MSCTVNDAAICCNHVHYAYENSFGKTSSSNIQLVTTEDSKEYFVSVPINVQYSNIEIFNIICRYLSEFCYYDCSLSWFDFVVSKMSGIVVGTSIFRFGVNYEA